MSKYTETLKIADQLEEHAIGMCNCNSPAECAETMEKIIKNGAQALALIEEKPFTPAQVERANGNTWLK